MSARAVVGALPSRLPRRAMLVAMDLVRAAIALLLPFVTEIWQVYVLIFLLQSASAAFTPTFQATIPDVLPEEANTPARCRSRGSPTTCESLIEPDAGRSAADADRLPLALFAGTVAGFLVSAALVLSVDAAQPEAAGPQGGI